MAIPRYASPDAWPLLSAGFRPFFLCAGVWACVAMALWMPLLSGTLQLRSLFDPVAWHFHEMVFGFVSAAIAGFLLTAIPNWTGRLPLQGWPLGGLVLVWLLGRISVAFSATTGGGFAAVADMSFLVVFGAVVGREIIAGRTWRNLPVLVALGLLIAANAMSHAGALGHTDWGAVGKRLAVAVIIMLISLIGGRIIPSFTGNWLRRRGAEDLPVAFDRFDIAVLTVSGFALATWVIFDLTAIVGVLLLVAAVAHAARLARWRGSATWAEPLVWILHIGYAWLPLGLLLLGGSAWSPHVTTSALHALTVGGMGTMILAVMTRASLGHTGAALTADRGTLIVYLLVLVAAAARLFAPFVAEHYMVILHVTAGAWIAAFALFTALYLPRYIRK
ncbi:MAG: NnrS family protein [Proteobacteria bacterium]|nr:NnrS family protein [Pseudomonadota bacterium]